MEKSGRPGKCKKCFKLLVTLIIVKTPKSMPEQILILIYYKHFIQEFYTGDI